MSGHRVLIGVPCGETLCVEYVNALLRLKKPPGTEVMHLPSSLVHVAREAIAEHALRGGYTHLLWLDSDMQPPADALVRLLEHGLDIVGALCVQRKPPYSPTAYSRLRLGEVGESDITPIAHVTGGLDEVEGIGCGCTLVRVEVLEAVRRQNRLAYHPMPGYGEDLSFCLRARRAGYRIYVDTGLVAGHVGRMVCTDATWAAYRAMQGVEA